MLAKIRKKKYQRSLKIRKKYSFKITANGRNRIPH